MKPGAKAGAAKGRGGSFKGKIKPKPEGRFRLSQSVLTFGPGSMVDLVSHAAVVREVDQWRGAGNVIQEDRLRLAILRSFASEEPKLSLNPSAPFRTPPVADEREPSREQGISAAIFPRWFVCQNAHCRRLWQPQTNDITFEGKVNHACRDGKSSTAVPVRFVATCTHGHLGEFPWITFAHGAPEGSCSGPELYLEEGSTGDFGDIRVQCRGCESPPQSLAGAMRKDVKLTCAGHRVWMGNSAKEECGEKLVLMVRTASNSYFAMSMGALSIPSSKDSLWNVVTPLAETIQYEDEETLAKMLTRNPKLAPLRAFSVADILEVRERILNQEKPEEPPLKTAEFATFMSRPPYVAGEVAPDDADFFARTLPRPALSSGSPRPSSRLPDQVDRVVVVSKLREVRALCGFTRVLPPVPSLDGGYEGGVTMARISRTTDFLPAVEVFGEGVFFSLSESALAAWEKKPVVQARRAELELGFAEYLATLDPKAKKPEFHGIRFYLLHSLAHLVMSQVALSSGYAASAIRERIYCSKPDDTEKLAGILLSTGSNGSEGTLGGLAQESHRLAEHLRGARQAGSLCSYDPVCAHHEPRDRSERYLEGAACHGCLFVAECSCEWFNRYLDRALVFPTIGHEDVAFFGPEDP